MNDSLEAKRDELAEALEKIQQLERVLTELKKDGIYLRVSELLEERGKFDERVKELEGENAELQEYKAMYEGLCK